MVCTGLPLKSERVSGIVNKYKELTLKRLEEAKNNPKEEQSTETSENKEGQDKVGSKVAKKEKPLDIEKALFSESEIGDLVKNVVAACWYERSTIYTPFFITKVSNTENKKEKM